MANFCRNYSLFMLTTCVAVLQFITLHSVHPETVPLPPDTAPLPPDTAPLPPDTAPLAVVSQHSHLADSSGARTSNNSTYHEDDYATTHNEKYPKNDESHRRLMLTTVVTSPSPSPSRRPVSLDGGYPARLDRPFVQLVGVGNDTDVVVWPRDIPLPLATNNFDKSSHQQAKLNFDRRELMGGTASTKLPTLTQDLWIQRIRWASARIQQSINLFSQY